MEDWLEKSKKEFGKLLSRVKLPQPGTYDIEVADVLGIGSYMIQPEVAVIEDTEGRVWAIPEGEHLVSRHDVEKGMKLRVVVIKEDGEKDISEVLVL